MKFSPSESKMIELIGAMPDRSYSPDADMPLHPEIVRIMRRLERKGVITIEQVDVGFRYSLRDRANG